MGDLVASVGPLTRAADSLLRMAGGRAVLLRVPVPGVPGDDGEQLGLATPGFQDVELGPVVFRKARAKTAEGKAARYELMVSATAVGALVGSLGFASVTVLFGVAAAVVVDERLLFVETVTESEVSGEIYCYRVGLRGAVGLSFRSFVASDTQIPFGNDSQKGNGNGRFAAGNATKKAKTKSRSSRYAEG